MSVDKFYSIFGLVTGIIGMLAAIPLSIIYNRLPSNKILYLESMHSETQKLFDSVVAEGLIDDDAVIALIHKNLWKYVPRRFFSLQTAFHCLL